MDKFIASSSFGGAKNKSAIGKKKEKTKTEMDLNKPRQTLGEALKKGLNERKAEEDKKVETEGQKQSTSVDNKAGDKMASYMDRKKMPSSSQERAERFFVLKEENVDLKGKINKYEDDLKKYV